METQMDEGVVCSDEKRMGADDGVEVWMNDIAKR